MGEILLISTVPSFLQTNTHKQINSETLSGRAKKKENCSCRRDVIVHDFLHATNGKVRDVVLCNKKFGAFDDISL